MNMRELSEALGVTPRQVRYMIVQKFVPPPSGGRQYAYYSEEHISAIQRYMRLKKFGFTPGAIRALLDAKEGVPVPVTPEITLIIDPKLFASGTASEPLLLRIRDLLERILDKDFALGSR